MNDLQDNLSQVEPQTHQVRLRISHNSFEFMNRMKTIGVDGGSLVNLGLMLLEQRLEPIGTTEERIAEVLLTEQKINF